MEEVFKMWRCGVCGYIHDGEEAPEKCPKCGAPKEKFTALEEAAAEKIEVSRYTNSLQMELSTLMETVKDLCIAGIEDDLDPPCVSIFKETLKFATETQQKIKAEIQSHISKGKWG